MKLHNVLYGVAAIAGLLGIAGIDGVMTFGTGLVICIVLLMICVISSIWGMYEDGVFRKGNSPTAPTKAQGAIK